MLLNVPIHLTSMPCLQRLFNDLLPLMEEWSGKKLKSTACYGVRHYFRDSVLANHVDRVDTHVISAIINVEQVRKRRAGLPLARNLRDFMHHKTPIPTRGAT